MGPPQAASGPLRVLVADDHALVRDGLAQLVGGFDGVEVVATTANGADALDAAARMRVDVALIDLAMPRLGGIETIRRLRDVAPATRAVAVTMYGSEEYVLQALEAGAHGFVLKGAGAGELEIAVRAASRGDSFLCPTVAGPVLAAYVRDSNSARGEDRRLSPRQLEVLQLVGAGLSSKVIAARLGLSVKTVNAHRTAVMRRLGVERTADLVREAVRTGLVPP